MEPQYLAKLALARLPRPYRNDVTFHVFCEIERTPHLREAYDKLLKRYKRKARRAGRPVVNAQRSLNKLISQSVGDTLNGNLRDPSDYRKLRDGECEIVGGFSLLHDIKRKNWRPSRKKGKGA